MTPGIRIEDVFQVTDEPSARLMKLKAECLLTAGVITVSEAEQIFERTSALIRESEKASELGTLPIHFVSGRYWFCGPGLSQ